VDRLLARSNALRVTYQNVHKLMLTCLLIAVKFHDDDKHCAFSGWCQVGKVTRIELCQLEKSLMSLIGFDLYVDKVVYSSYTTRLHNQIRNLQKKDMMISDMTNAITS